MELPQVEQHRETRVELVSVLKEGAASSSLVAPVVKPAQAEGVVVVDVEGSFPGGPKDKALASASVSTSNLSLPLARYAQATQVTLTSLGAPPDFDPLHEFQLHLEEEYGGFRRDQMEWIQDF